MKPEPKLPVLAFLLLAAGCGEPARVVETRVAARPAKPVVIGATSEQRFDRAPAGNRPTDQSPLDWEVPSGWTPRPSTMMRLANFQIGDTTAECYLSLLPGDAGGLLPNINRWRGQMGQDPLDGSAVKDMEVITILGHPAFLVEIEGRFEDMDGSAQENAALRGAILPVPMGSVFVKMTGPRDVVASEREAFLEFCASLRVHEGTSDAASHASTQPELVWEAPPAWQEDDSSPQRVVTFHAGPEGSVECYVSMFGGGGSLFDDFNRWRGQLGLSPLKPAEFGDLELVRVLGDDTPLFEAFGSYTGGMDGSGIADAGMLAVMRDLDGHAVFVKMIGPADDVRAERARFVGFVGTLRRAQ